MFLVKKIVAPFLFPVPLVLALLGLGLLLLWFTRNQRAGKIFVTSGFCLLLVLSLNPVGTALVRPLETDYRPLLSALPAGIRWIVVLDAGHAADPRLPVTTQLSGATLSRLAEGIRLYKQTPGSKLIVSGGKVFSPVAGARPMSAVAQIFGVPAKDLVLEDRSRDTREEAQYIKPIIGTAPFLLVTSATHMPRSMELFKELGMKPVAAPTDYLVKSSGKLSPGVFIPSAGALALSERAFYERIGMLWTKLTQ